MAESTLSTLAERIGLLHERTQQAAVQQVNYWLTVRNWLIGWHIAEYEQHGADRAAYGARLMPELARRLQQGRGLSAQQLYRCVDFYRTYPAILSTLSGELTGLQLPALPPLEAAASAAGLEPRLLLSRLSFSHFLELLPLENPLQRAFYEVHAVKNSWSVRELKRAIESALYERTGLSTDKAAVLAGHAGTQALAVTDVVKNPYVLVNYYRENEMSEGDNPPVGLILCAQKNDTLVRYATSGMAEQMFVSKYRVNLPSEAELQELVRAEQVRLAAQEAAASPARNPYDPA